MLHAGAIGAEGRFMAELLRESGADTSLLREVDGPSGHAVIEINAAGQNRIIVFGGANRRETREYIERVLDTAQPDDWVLLQNEVNLVPEIIQMCIRDRPRTDPQKIRSVCQLLCPLFFPPEK